MQGLSAAFLLGGGFKQVVRLLEAAGYRRCVRPGERGTPKTTIRAVLKEAGVRDTHLGRVLTLLGVTSRSVSGINEYGVTRSE